MRKEALLVIIVCVFLTLSIAPSSCESNYVLVKEINILSGPTKMENNVTYIQEDENYIVRLKLVFPPKPGESFKIKSHLHGFVNIVERNIRSRSGEATFESKRIPETLTIDLEGIAPKALVDDKGSEITHEDDRRIKGEAPFSFFDVYLGENLFPVEYEEELDVILSSSEILVAREKIDEAREAIAELESCSISDLHTTRSVILHMEKLLEIAEKCLEEGAPAEALSLANECLELVKIAFNKDQIQSLTSLLGEIKGVNLAESSSLAHEALDEIGKIDNKDDIDVCLSHIMNAEIRYEKATGCLISEVNREVAKYEIDPAYFALIIAVLVVIILVVTFFAVYVKKEKSIYDRGVEEGKKIAAEKEISPRDIILGRGEGEE
ncbi:MAG: hypothetical protein HXS48_19990 [Theionarchaea archaeon]|nr:hypothetical protein [Theionarchaea archaeon]